MQSLAFRKANQLKDDIKLIMDKFMDVAEYWIELENQEVDLIILKLSLKSNLQETLELISGDISGAITYDVEILDLEIANLEEIEVVNQRPDFQRFFQDVEDFDNLINRPFVKEIEQEIVYEDADRMGRFEENQKKNLVREGYDKINNYNLGRVIKIKVIDELV